MAIQSLALAQRMQKPMLPLHQFGHQPAGGVAPAQHQHIRRPQLLLRAGHPYPMAGTQGRRQYTGISGHHRPPMPAGSQGIGSPASKSIELVQGIPIEGTVGLGKGEVRDASHMSEPIASTRAQACKEAVEHELLGEAALADQGADEMGQGQLTAAREGAGVLGNSRELGEGIAADVLAQIGKQVCKGSAAK